MIRWSIQRDFIPIPKTKRKERIKENFDVFDFRLSEGDMQILVSAVYNVFT